MRQSKRYLSALAGVAALFFALNTLPVQACSMRSDCQVNSGDYRIFLPQDIAEGEKIPAIVYAHGLTGSSREVFLVRGFTRMATRLGIAFIAVNGGAGSWNFPEHVIRAPRDDFNYFREVLADIKTRFPIDENKIIMSGFSIGASMTWNLACRAPEPFAGFIPVAGTMWRPQPSSCKTTLGHVHHYHGTADRTFPLTGRRAWGKHQGDIRDTFEIIYRQDGCTRKIIEETRKRGLRCKKHKNCNGEPLSFCLHDGEHNVSPSHIEDGFRRIALAKGWSVPE